MSSRTRLGEYLEGVKVMLCGHQRYALEIRGRSLFLGQSTMRGGGAPCKEVYDVTACILAPD